MRIGRNKFTLVFLLVTLFILDSCALTDKKIDPIEVDREVSFIFEICQKLEKEFYDPNKIHYPKIFNAALEGIAERLEKEGLLFTPMEIEDCSSDEEALQIFIREFQKAKTLSINSEGISENCLMFSAANKLLESMNDSHTRFMTPESRERFLRPSYLGIGIVFAKLEENFYYISDVFPGGSAHRAGLNKFDRILKVDGQKIPDNLQEIHSLIESLGVANFELVIERQGETLTFNLKREAISFSHVGGEIIERGGSEFAYIKFTRFRNATKFEIVLSELLAQNNPDGIIIDLRNNRGGRVVTLIEIVSLFVPENTLIFELGNSTLRTSYHTEKQPITDLPMVVLINRNSSSASEIMAATFKETGRAIVIGEKSRGSVSAGRVFRLSHDAGMMVTTFQVFTPRGNNIEGVGLFPDKEIKISRNDILTANDSQLESAIEELVDSE